MPMTPHETYYEKVKEHAHDDMARVTGKPKPTGQDELLCALAYALKHGTCEEAALREQIFQQKIDLEAAERKCCCDKNATAIAALSAIVAQITKIGVPNTVLCPGVPAVTITNATTGTTPAA